MKPLHTAAVWIATAFSLIGLVCTGRGPELWHAMIDSCCDCDHCRADRLPDDEVAR